MAYLDELLGRGERIIYIARQHTFILVSNILGELSLIAVLVAAGVAAQAYRPNVIIMGQPASLLVMLVLLVLSVWVLISGFIDYLRWRNRQYIITDHRVIQIDGVLNKEVTDSSIEKINDLELHQSFLGRIFDYGDLEIMTGSEIGVNHMRKIAHPLDFKRALLEAKQDFRRGYGYLDDGEAVAAYTQPAAATYDIRETIQKLADLRDQGILSAEEFEAKKRDLLNRI